MSGKNEEPKETGEILYPDAHPGAPGDPKLIGEILPAILDQIEAAQEPPEVTAARKALAELLDHNRQHTATQEELSAVQTRLRNALNNEKPIPPID